MHISETKIAPVARRERAKEMEKGFGRCAHTRMGEDGTKNEYAAAAACCLRDDTQWQTRAGAV